MKKIYSRLMPVGCKTVIIFITLFNSFCSGQDSTSTIVDIDGNTYKTVKIGNQWWLAENLKVTHYCNGDPIHHSTDNSTLSTGAYYTYNNNDSIAMIYGLLYNWYAVNDNRKISPNGWHVPTDSEWRTLIDYLGGSTVPNGQLRETGTTHWRPNVGASNKSGFSALPGGFFGYEYLFRSLQEEAYFWTSTESSDTSSSWFLLLDCYNSSVINGYGPKNYGLSIRLIRN